MTRILAWSGAALAVAPAACARSGATNCDGPALERIIEGLHQRADRPASAVAAIEALSIACPAVPASMPSLLACAYGQDPERRCGSQPERLRAITPVLCLEPPRAAEPGEPRREYAAEFYDTCGLSRFEILGPDEHFYPEDLAGWALVAWLDARDTPPDLSRRFARRLMHATASTRTLADRCSRAPLGDACIALVDAHGMTLARSSGVGTVDATARRLFVRPRNVVFESQPVSQLHDGVFSRFDADNHQIESLGGPLSLMAAADEALPVIVYADQGAHYGTVIDVLYSAARQNLRAVAVAVDTARTPGAIPVYPPRTWFPDDGRQYDAACLLHVTIDGERVRVETCGGESTTLRVDDAAGIAALARTAAKIGGSAVALRATADTPWATAVAVLDAVRGAECPLWVPSSEPAPESCWYHHAMLDLDPPIPWRAGRWDGLSLRIDQVEIAQDANPRQYTTGVLQARAQALLPELRQCLVESEALQIRRPSHVRIEFMRDAAGTEFTFVPLGASTQYLPACIGETFAPLAEHPSWLSPSEASVHLAIDVPEDAPTDAP